jgi:hypothetical protein
MAGISYSLPSSTFTVKEALPGPWTDMEMRVPIRGGGTEDTGDTTWVAVKTERWCTDEDGVVLKTVTVESNPLDKLVIHVWAEDSEVLGSDGGEGGTEDAGAVAGKVGFMWGGGGAGGRVVVEVRLRTSDTNIVCKPVPTSAPTAAPSAAPTGAPTAAPTDAPPSAPTGAPTDAPTSAPTGAPTPVETAAPSAASTEPPTASPTASPTLGVTTAPTVTATEAATEDPEVIGCVANCSSEPETCGAFWAMIGEGGCANDCSEEVLVEFAGHNGCALTPPAEVVVVTVPAEMSVEIAEVPAAGSSAMKVRTPTQRQQLFSCSYSQLFTGARRRPGDDY